MRKRKALRIAIASIYDKHGSLVGDHQHVAETVECDCDYGRAARRLVALAPTKKGKSLLNGKLSVAPFNEKKRSNSKKATVEVS